MYHVALVTHRAEPELQFGDLHLMEPLARRGIRASARPWDAPTNWRAYDAVVIRSAWNYHHQPLAFQQWLDHLEDQGVTLHNPARLVRWNMDKRYLLHLAERGVSILPTVSLEAGKSASLLATMQEKGWREAVIKPRISGSGDNTFRVTREQAEAHQPELERLLGQGGVLVQPFAEAIRHGEWSLVFFNGIYSHAVLKHPAEGGFFVHVQHGGTTRPAQASPWLVSQASRIVNTAQALAACRALYARVDGLLMKDAFVLMELELIEPELFLHQEDATAERFADALAQSLIHTAG